MGTPPSLLADEFMPMLNHNGQDTKIRSVHLG